MLKTGAAFCSEKQTVLHRDNLPGY